MTIEVTPSWKPLLDTATVEELTDLYAGIMKPHDLDPKKGLFVVRQWDGMDGAWCDVTAAVTWEAALRKWFERTEGGSVKTSFNDIDYYRIFPAGTTMHYSGDRELYR